MSAPLSAHLDVARRVADAVLYEGYLLYPYRASSSKNRARWQFGVLGPPGATEAGLGEEGSMAMQGLLAPAAGVDGVELVVHVRFLQLQHRQVVDDDGHEVARHDRDGQTWLTWDEAVEQEVTVALSGGDLVGGPDRGARRRVAAPAAEETAEAGRLVRRRWPITAELAVRVEPVEAATAGLTRLEVSLTNTGPGVATKDEATRHSLLGAHVIVEARGGAFVSLLEPPEHAAAAAAGCRQQRCWPVLGGRPGDTDVLLGLPIILYDYPEVAQESPGAMFDATEIDEILSLRVLTMTDEEKAEARATDPLAREIIDRCDAMDRELLEQLHGTLRPPYAAVASTPGGLDEIPTFTDLRDADPPAFDVATPWWDPAVDAAVDPDRDAVWVGGVRVARGSRVRVRPSRRADAHDLFFAGQVARVSAVLADVDGGTHVAVVFVDDPAADLMEETGRYYYFAPDEIEPLVDVAPHQREGTVR